jgi:hypothetical protein
MKKAEVIALVSGVLAVAAVAVGIILFSGSNAPTPGSPP